ncbi:MAG TPA: DUF2007 domain-containing protein [Dehalococcoidia bacterium]|nr:DUF2007 domain-containing protein [Dehalococcoidia bacterium]
MTEDLALTVVYLAYNLPEAEIVKGRLESEGIPVLLRYESAGLVYGITVDGLAQVKVCVPQIMAERARAILNRKYNQDITELDR